MYARKMNDFPNTLIDVGLFYNTVYFKWGLLKRCTIINNLYWALHKYQQPLLSCTHSYQFRWFLTIFECCVVHFLTPSVTTPHSPFSLAVHFLAPSRTCSSSLLFSFFTIFMLCSSLRAPSTTTKLSLTPFTLRCDLACSIHLHNQTPFFALFVLCCSLCCSIHLYIPLFLKSSWPRRFCADAKWLHVDTSFFLLICWY